jgi:antitoxin MazE
MSSASKKRLPRTLELKLVRIGNSRGVRLPKAVIDRYALRESVLVEEHDEGLLLRSKRDRRLSWKETYRAAAREREDWTDLEAALADGLDPRDKW